MSGLEQLAARCEAATGPDRELDRQIELAVMPERVSPDPTVPLLAYTASLDAAMTLVPEGAAVQFQSFGGPGPMALVSPNERYASAATPALALCAAALRARARQSGEGIGDA